MNPIENATVYIFAHFFIVSVCLVNANLFIFANFSINQSETSE